MVDFIDKAICNNENDFWNHKIGQSWVKAIVTENLIKKGKGWLYVLIMSPRHFRVNLHSIVAWVSRNSLLKAGGKSEV